MPAVQEAIKRLRYEFTSTGADKVASDANKVGDAVVVASTKQEKAALSLDKSFAGLERRFNTTIRAQQDYEKIQQRVNAAVAQNPALMERANRVLAQARDHFDRLAHANDNARGSFQRMAQALATVQGPLGPIAGRLSSMGSLVGGVGLGFAAAGVAIGGFAVAAFQAVQAANQLADRAGRMVDFAETTGLTTTQLQALQKAAAFVGIEADKVGQGFEFFSVKMEELRRGTGGLYEAMNRIDPAMTVQLARTRDLGEAWDVVSRAIKAAEGEQANALAKAGFGRSGVPFTRLAGATADAGGIAALEAALGRVNTLTTEQLKRWDEMKDRIDFVSKTARDNITSIFADSALSAQLRFYEDMLALSQLAKQFTISEDLKKLLSLALDASYLGRLASLFGSNTRGSSEGRLGVGIAGGVADGLRLPGTSIADYAGAGASVGSSQPALKLEFQLAQLKAVVAAMGAAATAADQLRVKEMALKVALDDKVLTHQQYIKALAATRLESVIALEQKRLSLLGDLASVEDQVAAKRRQIDLERMQGLRISDAEVRAILERTRVQAEAAKPENQVKFQREMLFLTEQEARIRQQLLGWGIDWNSERGKALATELRINDTLREGIDIINSGLKSVTDAILQGRRGFEAWAPALDLIGSRLRDIGARSLSRSLVSGVSGNGLNLDPVSLGIGLVGTLIGAFTGNRERRRQQEQQQAQELQQAQEAWRGMTDQVRAFNEAARGVDLQPLTQGLRQAFETARDLVEAAGRARDVQGQNRVIADYLMLVRRTLDEFASGTPVLDEFGQRLKDAIDTATQLAEEIRSKGLDAWGITDAETKISEGLRRLVQQIGTDFTNDLQAKINEALGKGYLNQIGDLVTQRQQQLANIDALRAQGFNVDPALIDRYFAVQAQRIIDDANLVGVAFDELIAAFPDLAGVVHESTRAIEEQIEEQRRLREEMNQTARSILDYVNNLLGGSQSTLSPGDRYNAALATYNAQIALAQTGDAGAQAGITQYAENLRTAAQAMFASGAGYQAIFGRITQELVNLPAVQQADDPVVVALRDAIEAIQQQTFDIGDFFTAQTAALQSSFNAIDIDQSGTISQLEAANTWLADIFTQADTNHDGVIDALEFQRATLIDAIQANNPAAIANALAGSFDTLDTSLNGLLDFNELMQGLGPLARDQSVVFELQKIFSELDLNGDGQIDRLELIKTAAQGTNTNTAATTSAVAAANLLNAAIKSATEAMEQWGGSGVLDEIKNLNTTARLQLELLNQQLAGTGVSFSTSPSFAGEKGSVTVGGVNVNNTLIAGINKIVYNTKQIADNTRIHLDSDSNTFAAAPGTNVGAYAQGGMAPANTLAIFGEHHPDGPWMMRTHAPTMITPNIPFANDNSAVVEELRALRAEVVNLRRESATQRKALAEIQRAAGVRVDEAIRDEGEKKRRSDATNATLVALARKRA